MIFGGAKYLHTRDIGKLKDMYAWFFFLWGAPGGHREFVGARGGGTSIIEGGRDVPLDRVWFSRSSILAQDI